MWIGKISSRNILVKSRFITHRIVKLRRRARWETGEGSPLSQPSSLRHWQRDRGTGGGKALRQSPLILLASFHMLPYPETT